MQKTAFGNLKDGLLATIQKQAINTPCHATVRPTISTHVITKKQRATKVKKEVKNKNFYPSSSFRWNIFTTFALAKSNNDGAIAHALAKSNNDGAIAQLVEQRTENPCVPGSIPGGTT